MRSMMPRSRTQPASLFAAFMREAAWIGWIVRRRAAEHAGFEEQRPLPDDLNELDQPHLAQMLMHMNGARWA